MPNAIDWSQVTGLDPAVIAQTIDFPVNVEPMLSKDNQLLSSRNMVSIVNADKEIVKLGEVSPTRPLIRHKEAMELAIRELDNVGTPYKLRQSILDKKKFSLYQEYIFDHEIDVPDGEAISPMVVLHCDYSRGSPLTVSVGTYRYVCANGALVAGAGGMINVRVDNKNWDMLQKIGFSNDLKASLDHYKNVSDFYANLNTLSYSSYLKKLLTSNLLPISFKKHILGVLEENGEVTINVETTKTNVESYAKLVKVEDLAPEVFDNTVNITGDDSMWKVYNIATEFASHRINSGYQQVRLGSCIDRAFHKMLTA